MQQVSGSIQSQCTKLKAQRLPYFNANLGKNDWVVDTERLTANTPRKSLFFNDLIINLTELCI